jgi:hypothetical protein
MPDGYQLDPATLETVTSSLRKAGTTLENLDGGPGAPDAGELTDVIGSMMAKLVEDALELAAGIAAAGDQLDHTRTEYLTKEQQNRQAFAQ